MLGTMLQPLTARNAFVLEEFGVCNKAIAQPGEPGASPREWWELPIGVGCAFSDLRNGSKKQAFTLDQG